MARSRHSLDEERGRGRDSSSDSSGAEKSPEREGPVDAQDDKLGQKAQQQSAPPDEMDVRA